MRNQDEDERSPLIFRPIVPTFGGDTGSSPEPPWRRERAAVAPLL